MIDTTERETAVSEQLYQVRCASCASERWDAIRKLYVTAWPLVKTAPVYRWAFEPNEADWLSHMTPIEAAVWSVIRDAGAVLYPQHPVGNYFVDFGHPVARVALECDGWKFHQDRQKDAERQQAIEAKGWTVYRLWGSECLRLRERGHWHERDDGWDEPDSSPAATLVEDLCREYGLSARYRLTA